jgi:hypothetical protein
MQAVHCSKANYFKENKNACLMCICSDKNNPRTLFFDNALFKNGESTAEVI